MILPGPDIAIVSRFTLSGGRISGYKAAAGICCSYLCYSVLIVLGVVGLVFQSQLLIELLRYAGGAYLIYLGVAGFKAARADQSLATGPALGTSAFKAGALSNLFNPKQAIFLVALLPQFTGGDESALMIVKLLAVLLLISLLFWAVWVWSLSKLGARFAQHHTRMEQVSSAALIAVGLLLIFGVI